MDENLPVFSVLFNVSKLVKKEKTKPHDLILCFASLDLPNKFIHLGIDFIYPPSTLIRSPFSIMVKLQWPVTSEMVWEEGLLSCLLRVQLSRGLDTNNKTNENWKNNQLTILLLAHDKAQRRYSAQPSELRFKLQSKQHVTLC